MPFGAGFDAYPGVPDGVAHLAPRFGIYVHVPFCARICPYCDFNVYVDASGAGEYLAALVDEARAWAEREGPFAPAGSLFVGGGTPTLVDPGELGAALDRIRAWLPVAADAEVTAEANPEDCHAARLVRLRRAGVNRLSLGAQSFDAAVLAALGRAHAPEGIARAVEQARDAGIRNIGLDLIFGGPGESLASWERTLGAAIGLGPQHVSCYALTIEPGTAFGRDVAAGRRAAPDDDALAAAYELAIEMLGEAGFRHYEISNWARPGFESRHNLVYWTQGEYVGVGAGAHSHVGGVRSWNRKLPRAYTAAPAAARAGEERLDDAQRAEEWLHLRLRLVEGLDCAEARTRLGRDLRPAAAHLAEAGLVRLDGDRLTLTTRGLLLENEVALRLSATPEVPAPVRR